MYRHVLTLQFVPYIHRTYLCIACDKYMYQDSHTL